MWWYISIAIVFFILGKLHSNKKHYDECNNCNLRYREYYPVYNYKNKI